MTEEIILTKEGYEKLQAELRDLVGEKRPAVIERIARAKEYGDLAENSEYEDARNQQSFIEGRIEELQAILKNARVVSRPSKKEEVGLGSRVVCEVKGKKEVFEIVGVTETDPSTGKISPSSPVGRALMEKKVGEVVTVETPEGTINLKILKIE